MSLLKAYLKQPRVQKVLKSKPQDTGFSLIELVVVVAVLAILAAIAIPQFSQLSDDARLNSTKSIIANMYKECEFNKARTGSGFHTKQVDGTPNGVFWGENSLIDATDGTGCNAFATAKIGGTDISTGAACIIAMDMTTGTTFYDNAASAPAMEAGSAAGTGGTSGDWTSPWADNLEDCT